MATQINKVRRNILLTPTQDDDLNTLCAHTGASRSHVLRTALLAHLRHTQEEQPTCADGTHCLCLARWGRIGAKQSVPADVS